MLRPLRDGDLGRFHGYRSSPELARYQGWVPMTRAAAAAFLRDMRSVEALLPGRWQQLAIADRDDRLIGDLGLCLDADGRACELGFTLRSQSQGQGHAARAIELAFELVFATTAATTVLAVTDVRNAASIRVLRRTGFAFVEERAAVFKGEACREYVYARRS